MSSKRFPAPSLRERLACAAGALLTTTAVLAALLGAFHQLSADPWLLPTPEVLELAAQCQARPERVAREACLHQVVASRVKPGAGDARLARRELPADGSARP